MSTAHGHEPRDQGMLEVGDGALLHWEEWGTRGGTPALYLHGGPGSGLGTSGYRQRFDLARTRVVAFDQRGCGRSTPHAADPSTSLEGQDTARLIDDIERLREHLGVDRWLVNGVSWGSTLALAYAQAHPKRVLGLVLYAVTTTSRREVDWITEGVGRFVPEAWDRFAGHAEDAGIGYHRGQGRLVEAYSRLLASPDPSTRDAASREWALWEDTHLSIGTGTLVRDPRWEDDRFRLAFVRLTTHYWSHDGFCRPPLLAGTQRVAGLPAVLLHGRRDISSPVETAWELHRRWPGSTLVVRDEDGHGGAALLRDWREANTRMVSRVSGA